MLTRNPTGSAHIVVIDDDAGIVDDLVETLGETDYRVTGTTSPQAVLDLVTTDSVDLILADVVMPTMRGDELLRKIHEINQDQLVILMTAFGSIEQGVDAIQAGACDFIAKPFPPATLLLAAERALRERQIMREIVRLRRTPAAEQTDIVSLSKEMSHVVDVARRAAQSQVTVLITGESGVGKGLLASAIHQWSGRATEPFVNLNCAALPPSLAEAELFGARKGAYTDAKSDRDGLFVKASGGTLFLDEIAELSLELQPKLLRALEGGHVRPVGGVEEVQIATRLIAATNAPLEQVVSEGRFRSDLYHRLNVVRIEIPPLRARTEDLPALIDRLLPRISSRLGRPVNGVSAAALRWLTRHSWPGNVRELSNTLERAVALAEHDTLLLEDVQPRTALPNDDTSLETFVRRESSLAEVESAYVQRVLESVDFNKAQASRILKIDRRTLYRKLASRDDADG